MKITHDYFLAEWHGFREIMCSTAYTPEQKFDAWGGLLSVFFACPFDDKENEESRRMCMKMLVVEFPMRMSLEASMELEKVFKAGLIAAALGDKEALEYVFKPRGTNDGD